MFGVKQNLAIINFSFSDLISTINILNYFCRNAKIRYKVQKIFCVTNIKKETVRMVYLPSSNVFRMKRYQITEDIYFQ